jgi:uncharacterized protein (TIGR02246 family)
VPPHLDGQRPDLARDVADAAAAVSDFVGGLQSGHDARDADILNAQFAADVEWGSPFGALVEGYDRLHPIHVRFQALGDGGPPVRYEVRHVHPVADDVVIAHVARLVLDPAGEPRPPTDEPDEPFSEMAMFVLVRRDGRWWLAAGQNTPMRPGGAVPART